MVVWLTLGAIVAGLGALIGSAAWGWRGTPVDCHETLCFCEVSSSTWWRQPVNTWSNLVPIGLSVVVAVEASRLEVRSGGLGVLRVLRVAFPLMLAFQGLGSMFFHASLKTWGLSIDAVSMFAITGLLLAVSLFRVGVFGARGLLGGWLGIIGLGFVAGWGAPRLVSPLILVLFLSLLGSEAFAFARGKTRSSRWFRGGVALFVAGVVVWYGSAIEGMPLCWPDSLFQGHALWHATSGLAVAGFWRHSLENLAPAS